MLRIEKLAKRDTAMLIEENGKKVKVYGLPFRVSGKPLRGDGKISNVSICQYFATEKQAQEFFAKVELEWKGVF
jgi:hypothetical protein